MVTSAPWVKQSVAELVGVFTLVFIGAGTIIATGHYNVGPFVTLVGIALAHGLAIFTMVTATAHVSGGHLNPAVSTGLLVARRMPATQWGVYVAAQILGGLLGALALRAAFMGFAADTLESTHVGVPSLGAGVGLGAAVLVEAVLTFFLVFVVFGAIDQRNESRIGAFAIGMAVTMGVLMGAFLTGGALNPARWFGPALVSMFWESALVYIVGPLLGGIVAGALYEYVLYEEPMPEVTPERAMGVKGSRGPVE